MLAGATVAAVPVIAQSTFTIDGVEVTQSVQHYRSSQHLRDGRDFGPDNSIPLIAGKTTYVRAYVRHLSGPAVPVVGTLTVERQAGSGWTPVATIESVRPVTPRAQSAYRTQRGDLSRTLNFVLPGPQVEGALRFTATARRSGSTTVAAQSQVALPRARRGTLRVAVITVGYRGPSGGTVITAPAPGPDVVRTVASHAVAAFPVSDAAEFRVVATITQNEPLLLGSAVASFAAPARLLGCPATWSRLMRRLREIRRADGPREGWLYYGLLANEIPYTSNTTGCGGGGLGTGKVERPTTMTHELGHAARQPHIPSTTDACTGDNDDDSYPIYEKRPSGSYPRGSIGEYGLDTRTGRVRRPHQVSDIMQYCTDRWISPWIYRRLMNENVFADQTVGASDSDRLAYRPLTVVTAVLSPNGSVEDPSVMELATRAEPIGLDLAGFHAELADAEGRVVASAPVQSTSLRGGGTGSPDCPCIIEALLPQSESGTRVRIVRGSQVLFESERRVAGGRAIGLEAIPSRDGVTLTWAGVEADQEVWIRFSDDGGKTWAMLDVGVHPDRSYRIARDGLPGPGPLLFEILASDATETRRAVSPELRLLPQ